MYVLPALLVHRRSLLQPSSAPAIWLKVARGVARSSLFLSLYCTLAWRGARNTLHLTPACADTSGAAPHAPMPDMVRCRLPVAMLAHDLRLSRSPEREILPVQRYVCCNISSYELGMPGYCLKKHTEQSCKQALVTCGRCSPRTGTE